MYESKFANQTAFRAKERLFKNKERSCLQVLRDCPLEAPHIEGLILLKKRLSKEQQLACVQASLTEYTAGNVSNLHAHYQIPDDIWKMYQKSVNELEDMSVIPVKKGYEGSMKSISYSQGEFPKPKG